MRLDDNYGIFQDWYLTHEFADASEASINSVGTVTLAIQYSECIICVLFSRRYARRLRLLMQGSLVVCVISMFLSSFATKVHSFEIYPARHHRLDSCIFL